MSDRAEIALHALGGALIGALEMWITGSAVMAIWWALVIGNIREQEQVRRKHPDSAHRPSAFWRWSVHRLGEWTAWPAGALAAICSLAAFS